MKEVIRRLAARTLDVRAVQRVLQGRNRDRGIIFMLHRIGAPGQRHAEQIPDTLREVLSFLRRHEFLIVRVGELLRRIQTPGEKTELCVAFTLDDGYRDQARLGAPVFAEFDAPATIFPVAGFVDGSLWMWWDRLEWMVAHSQGERIRLDLSGFRPTPSEGPETLELDLGTLDSQRRSLGQALGVLKRLPAAQRDRVLDDLAERCGVTLPASPPDEYAPMTWDDARACEAMGVTIGPHTVTHPILAREADEAARREMETSWDRVSEEVLDPEPVFCYPNGKTGDFGRREMKVARQLGLQGALSAEPGYVKPSAVLGESGLGRYALPRFSLPRDRPPFIRIVSGLAPDEGGLAVGEGAPPPSATE